MNSEIEEVNSDKVPLSDKTHSFVYSRKSINLHDECPKDEEKTPTFLSSSIPLPLAARLNYETKSKIARDSNSRYKENDPMRKELSHGACLFLLYGTVTGTRKIGTTL